MSPSVRRLALLLSCAIFANAPLQAEEQEVCGAFRSAIDSSLKRMSMLDAESIGDNSTLRASTKELEKVAELQLVSIHVQLMQENECEPIKQPISPSSYVLNAMGCQTARLTMMRNYSPKSKFVDPPECDFSKWKPLGSEKSKDATSPGEHAPVP